MQKKPIIPIEDEPINESSSKWDWTVAVAAVVLLITAIFVVVKVL